MKLQVESCLKLHFWLTKLPSFLTIDSLPVISPSRSFCQSLIKSNRAFSINLYKTSLSLSLIENHGQAAHRLDIKYFPIIPFFHFIFVNLQI